MKAINELIKVRQTLEPYSSDKLNVSPVTKSKICLRINNFLNLNSVSKNMIRHEKAVKLLTQIKERLDTRAIILDPELKDIINSIDLFLVDNLEIKPKKKINIYNHIKPDKYHLYRNGVFHDNKEKVSCATDGYTLLISEQFYNEQYSSEIGYKARVVNKRGEVAECQYPNYRNFIPKSFERAITIAPTKELRVFLKTRDYKYDMSNVLIDDILIRAKNMQKLLDYMDATNNYTILCNDIFMSVVVKNDDNNLLLCSPAMTTDSESFTCEIIK